MNFLINKIGLGTVQFGLNYGISNKKGITELAEVNEILKYAHRKGIDLIDTASGYGKSEEILGLSSIGSMRIVTKFLPSSQKLSIENQIRISLNHLKVKSIYGLLAHRPSDVTSNPAIWDYMKSLKDRNIVCKIGFSFNTTEEIDAILSKNIIPDIIQVPYNYIDNRFVRYMIDLKKNGCEIHTRSTFLQGLFFCDPNHLCGFFNEIKPLLNEIQGEGSNLSGMLLNYCLAQPFIDKVIIGVNNKEQLVQNINTLQSSRKLPLYTGTVNLNIITPSCWPTQ